MSKQIGILIQQSDLQLLFTKNVKLHIELCTCIFRAASYSFKGQIKPKADWHAADSPKKRTKSYKGIYFRCFCTLHGKKTNIFLFVFTYSLLNQSHYNYISLVVIAIFMEQKLRFGLALGQLAILKKSLGWLWATFEVSFFMFSGADSFLNIAASALKTYIKWS